MRTSAGGRARGRSAVRSRGHRTIRTGRRIGAIASAVVIRWRTICRGWTIYIRSLVRVRTTCVRRPVGLIHLGSAHAGGRIWPVGAKSLRLPPGIGDVALGVPRPCRSSIGTRGACAVERAIRASRWWPVRRKLLLSIDICRRIPRGAGSVIRGRRSATCAIACCSVGMQRSGVHRMHRQMRSACSRSSSRNYRAVLYAAGRRRNISVCV